jgi:hypothetical protein
MNSKGDFGRMARGSAGVAELIHSHSLGAWGNISILEQAVRLQQGAYHANQPWSLDGHARMEIAELNGHRTLKKLASTVRLYELSRLQPPEVVRSWVANVCKATIEAKNPNGNWTMSWPLLGIPGPDSLAQPLPNPMERVALAALAKERKVLEDAAKAATAS